MISWIQKTFQQHFRIIFAVLLAVTIISFIFTLGASPGIGRAGPRTFSQKFFGHDLTKQTTNDRVFGDASLSLRLRLGLANLQDADSREIQDYALQRAAALALADQLKLPAPSKVDVTNFIKNLGAFVGPDGQFDPSRYADFRNKVRTDARVSEGDVSRMIRDDLRVAQLQQLLAGPGFILPGEIRDQLVRTDAAWTIAVATTDFAAFKPEISVAEDALKRFYDDSAFRYDVAPRLAVDYVEYRAADFLGAVTVTDEEVRAYYDANPSRFPKPAENKAGDSKNPLAPSVTPSSDPTADFAAVRLQVLQTLRTERATRLAVKAAADLTVAIYEQRLKPNTPPLTAFLAGRKLTLKQAAPFNQDSIPQDLGWTPQIIEQALQLAEATPVSDALPAPTGSIVLFWRETLPSYRPTLAQVRERVVADFKENERRKQFVELGRTLRSQLEARVRAGDAFEKAAAGVQPSLEVKTWPAFARRQPPKEIEPAALAALERLDQGQVSDMLIAQEKGLFVYVKERKLPDLAETNPQYAAMRAQLTQMTAFLSQRLCLAELVARELKQSQPAAPSARP
jgi:peptidyl-prolyl cis-trans isomerase D